MVIAAAMNYELEKQKNLVAEYLVSQGSLIPLPPKGITLARECKKYRLGKGKVRNKTWHERVASAYQELLNAGAIDKNGLTGKIVPEKHMKSAASSGRVKSTKRDDQNIARLIIIKELRSRGYKISNVAGYVGLARKTSEAFGKPFTGSLTKGEAKRILKFYAAKISGGQVIPQHLLHSEEENSMNFMIQENGKN